MKITRVTPFLADLGGAKNILLVKVETDGGPHGWGECYTQADRDRSIVAHVEALGRYLVGRDAGQITHFVHMAYHDFAGKRGMCVRHGPGNGSNFSAVNPRATVAFAAEAYSAGVPCGYQPLA